jgi:hypothetical protein
MIWWRWASAFFRAENAKRQRTRRMKVKTGRGRGAHATAGESPALQILGRRRYNVEAISGY